MAAKVIGKSKRLMFCLLLLVHLIVCPLDGQPEVGHRRVGAGADDDTDSDDDDGGSEDCYQEALNLLKKKFPSSPHALDKSQLACKDKFGYSDVISFRKRSAVMCYHFLFESQKIKPNSFFAPSRDLLSMVFINSAEETGSTNEKGARGEVENVESRVARSNDNDPDRASNDLRNESGSENIEITNDIVFEKNRNRNHIEEISKMEVEEMSSATNSFNELENFRRKEINENKNVGDSFNLEEKIFKPSSTEMKTNGYGYGKRNVFNANTTSDDEPSSHGKQFIPTNQSATPSVETSTMDVLEEKNFKIICKHLGSSDCSRWMDCMGQSVQCCIRQIKKQCKQKKSSSSSSLLLFTSPSSFSTSSTSSSSSSSSSCPMTWDGFSCWDEAARGAEVKQQCPDFIRPAGINLNSHKSCSANGTWFTLEGQEWTDYTTCLDKKGHVIGVYINVVLNILNIVFLVQAILLFAYFRDLIRQGRIKLHVHFFSSLILVSVVNILWYILVHYDLLTAVGRDSVVAKNPVWCRLISFLKIYLKGTNFAWMFCEGYHLHRLISNAFVTIGSMTTLYAIGWCFPLVTTLTYAIVRYYVDNTECWAKNAGAFQWILYAPNCLCLLLNFIFLVNILRTLLFQLQSHPNEPNSFRRGIKAGLMLVPLFGVQLLFTAYRPDLHPRSELIYEYISCIIINSQGICVSIIFCFLNGEVVGHLKRKVMSWCRGRRKNRSQASMMNTKGTTVDLTIPNHFEDETADRGVTSLKLGQNNYNEQLIPLRELPANGL